MTPQDQAQQAEYDRQLKLLFKLEQLEEFQLWRDLVCKPVITQIETQLKNSDTLSEPVLRGTLKHYFSVKNMYYDVFESVRGELRSEAEQRDYDTQVNPPT